jgi:phenylalanyl-tRNA synthetase beta chain
LDKIAPGDISYEALPPKDIKFAPLNKETEYTAEEMMKLYKVGPFLVLLLRGD